MQIGHFSDVEYGDTYAHYTTFAPHSSAPQIIRSVNNSNISGDINLRHIVHHLPWNTYQEYVSRVYLLSQ